MKFMIDDQTYHGTPSEIVHELRSVDHGHTRDIDAFMQRVAADYRFQVVGETIDKRCENFINGLLEAKVLRIENDI